MKTSGNDAALQKKSAASGGTIKDLLKLRSNDISMALPSGLNAERFTRMVLVSINQNPFLAGCTPISLLAATMQAAQMGLEPGPLGHCALVPYWNSQKRSNEAQFQLMYKGMIQLSYNTKGLESVAARAVFSNDKFKMIYGRAEELIHEPNMGERGDLTGFYAYAHLTSGGFMSDWMTVMDVNKVRDYHSQAYKSAKDKGRETSPWHTNYEEMGCKTVLKRLWKLLPVSTENQRKIAADESIKSSIAKDMLGVPDEADKFDLGLNLSDAMPEGEDTGKSGGSTKASARNKAGSKKKGKSAPPKEAAGEDSKGEPPAGPDRDGDSEVPAEKRDAAPDVGNKVDDAGGKDQGKRTEHGGDRKEDSPNDEGPRKPPEENPPLDIF
jgi:recombination protein RecT